VKYKIIWSKFSEQQIDDIFEFYEQKSKSYDVALRVVTKIILAPDILIENPRIGQKEILLENREIEYRYLIETNWKIIYSIDDENKAVKVADVFDCRQEPEKIEKKK
jgi:toxin ParE1/3/4